MRLGYLLENFFSNSWLGFHYVNLNLYFYVKLTGKSKLSGPNHFQKILHAYFFFLFNKISK